MAITFGQAKERISQFAGRGGLRPDNPSVDSFVREVLDYMLISGQYGNERKFTFSAAKGIFTVPYELENIIKVKIDGQVGSSWDRWFEWTQSYGDFGKCLPSNEVLEEPNYSPIVYDIPPGSWHIGTLAMYEEDCEAYIIVKGYDATGREIITDHKGEQIVGEYLSLKKGHILYTNVQFSRITEIVKSKTNGYVQLLAVNPSTQQKMFLSEYSPLEEHPQYRRYRLNTRCGEFANISVLGRIRLKAYYSDNDLIPFDNLYALSIAAQGVNSNYNKDPQGAIAQDGMLQTIIGRENNIKKQTNGQTFEVFRPLSGGSIRGIVGNVFTNTLGWGRRW